MGPIEVCSLKLSSRIDRHDTVPLLPRLLSEPSRIWLLGAVQNCQAATQALYQTAFLLRPVSQRSTCQPNRKPVGRTCSKIPGPKRERLHDRARAACGT